MPRARAGRTTEDEASRFYIYLKGRRGEAASLSLREATELYRDYLIAREEADEAAAGPRYLSTSQAARVAGVSPQTIRNWIRAGIVPDVQVGNRKGDLRVPADFLGRVDLGIENNPDFADSEAYVRRIRAEHGKLSEEEYFALLDEAASGK